MASVLFQKVSMTKFLTIVCLTLAANPASATGGTSSTVSGNSSTMEDSADGPLNLNDFYSQKYLEKARANDRLAVSLAHQTQALTEAAMKANTPKKVAKLHDFRNRLKETLVSSRKATKRRCVRLAENFSNPKARPMTLSNCSTEQELLLEQRLRALEIEFKRLAN